jgi:hypothetical protein
MGKPRFTLGQLLKGVAIVAVLLGVARLCVCDPEIAEQLMPLLGVVGSSL